MFMFKGDRVIILRESKRDKRMNKRDVLNFPFEIQRGRETQRQTFLSVSPRLDAERCRERQRKRR